MKQTLIWNPVGFLGLAAIFTWALSVNWKTNVSPLTHLLTAVLVLITAVLALYLGAEDEEN